MVDIPGLEHIRNIRTHAYLGNIELYGSDLFKSMEEVLEYYHSRKHKRNFSKHKVIHLQDLEEDEVVPTVIKDIFNELGKHFNVHTVAGIIAFDGKNGVDWHTDPCDLIAMNVIGNTTWFFKDDSKVDMKPGDLLYVKENIMHKVVSYEERFCVSFIFESVS